MDNKSFFLKELSLNELDAYHGSPYDFDQFSAEFIGSGEGGQAHGWGLYFALNKDIAKKYQKNNSALNTRSTVSYSIENKIYKKGTVMFRILNTFKEKGKNKAIEQIQSLLNNPSYNDNDKLKISKMLDIIKNTNSRNISKKIELIKGQTYHVDIPELNFYLNENLKISEQPKNIKPCIKKLCLKNNISRKISNMTGRELYYFLKISYCNNDNKATSLLLLKNGIKGLYYRGQEDLECVTIFNANDVYIINKDYDISDTDILLPNEERILDNPQLISQIENPDKKLQMICVTTDPLAIKYIQNPDQDVIDTAFEKDYRIVAYDLVPSFNKIIETLNKDMTSFNKLYKFLSPDDINSLCKSNPTCILRAYELNNELPEEYVLLALKSITSETVLPTRIPINNEKIFCEILDNMFKSIYYEFIYASFRNIDINKIQNINHRNKLLFLLWERFISQLNTLYKSDIEVLYKRIKLNNKHYMFKHNDINIKKSCYLNNETIAEIIKIAIDLYDYDYILDLSTVMDKFNKNQKAYLYSRCPDYDEKYQSFQKYKSVPLKPNNMNIFKYIQ